MSRAWRALDYLEHIVRAIDRIARYTATMDEAANNIRRVAPQFAAQHEDIPWLVMYTMRNRVAHGYGTVDLEIIWKTIRSDLPGLRAQVTHAIATSFPAI